MPRPIWAWVVVLSCAFGWPLPLSAEPLPLDLQAPAACALDGDDQHPGLRRSDAFAPGDVVLTFDDGPQPGPTKKLLDLLDKHRLKATFFVVGLWLRDDTYHLIQRMVASGHEIGNHTYSHDLYLTRRGWGADYVEGQYELTHVLVELALLAKSRDHFREMYQRVFERKMLPPLEPAELRTRWAAIKGNHLTLLAEQGYGESKRLYSMLFARPPGGIPYEGRWPSKLMRQEHETALRRLGLMNILWHGGSGDTVLGKLDDFRYLVDNVRFHTKQGGVLLIHDRMRYDALVSALERLSKDPKIRVRTLRSAVEDKYSCDAGQLYAALRPKQTLAVRKTKAARPE